MSYVPGSATAAQPVSSSVKKTDKPKVRSRDDWGADESIGSTDPAIADEATTRGYSFDAARIVAVERPVPRITETKGQLLYEWEHLGHKLQRRSPAWHRDRVAGVQPTAHPLFRIVAGGVRDWERTEDAKRAR